MTVILCKNESLCAMDEKDIQQEIKAVYLFLQCCLYFTVVTTYVRSYTCDVYERGTG